MTIKSDFKGMARQALKHVLIAKMLPELDALEISQRWDAGFLEALESAERRADLLSCAIASDQHPHRGRAERIKALCEYIETHSSLPNDTEVSFMIDDDWFFVFGWFDNQYPETEALNNAVYEIGVRYGYYAHETR